MPKMKFDSPREWIEECLETVHQDLDNVVLLVGAEGNGKSTLAAQIARAFDPEMTIEQVAYSIEEYLKKGPSTPKFRCIWVDEVLANHRKGMHGEIIDLLDDLQICRGRNNHILLCFPHEDMLDKAILNYRVRWKISIPQRGYWVLSERITREFRHRSGEVERIFLWVDRGKWHFRPNEGAFWEAYLDRKEAHMRARQAALTEEKPIDLRLNVNGLRIALGALRRQYSERTIPRASLQNVPEA